MALLPAVRDEKTKEAIAGALAVGHRPPEIAKRLAPDDPAAQKRWRRRIHRYLEFDEAIVGHITRRARAEFLMGLGPAARALNRRADKGNVMAIKLLFEASGFHNPKVQHEHSGEITIKLDMPRPDFEAMGGTIEDAEVVED